MTATTLQKQIALTIDAARKEGYEGTDRAYDLTREDCMAIIEALGARPTREEWADAGYPAVGDAHVAHDCLYCDAQDVDTTDAVPDTGDDAAWAILAAAHAETCEWVLTRAHRR